MVILAVTLRGSLVRRRSRKPDILGFAVSREEGNLRVPLLVVTRVTRAKRLRGHLVDREANRTPITITWPALAVGAHTNQTLEVVNEQQ